MRNSIFKQALKTTRHISLEEEIQANVDVVNATNEIELLGSEIDHSQDVASVLEDLAVVADNIETPTPAESALFQLAGDAMVAGTGAEASALTPAMEEGGEGLKGFAQKAKETIKKIWEAIKAAFKKAFEWIKKLFTSSRTAIEGRAQRSKELREKLAKVKWEGPLTVWVHGSSLFDKNMTGAQAVKKLHDAFKELQNYEKLIEAQASDTTTNAESSRIVGSKLAKGEKGVSVVTKNTNPKLGVAKGSIELKEKANSGLKAPRYQYDMTNLGLQLKYVSLSGSTRVDSIDECFAALSELNSSDVMTEIEFVGTAAGGEGSKDFEVKIGSLKELSDGFAAVDAITDGLEKIVQTCEEGTATMETALGQLDAAVADYARDGDERSVKFLSTCGDTMRKVLVALARATSAVTKASLSTHNHYCSYLGVVVAAAAFHKE